VSEYGNDTRQEAVIDPEGHLNTTACYMTYTRYQYVNFNVADFIVVRKKAKNVGKMYALNLGPYVN
jgi:hypothetical protein